MKKACIALSELDLKQRPFCTRTLVNYLLDSKDCAESPMLGESRFRRRWVRRSVTASYYVPFNELRSFSYPKIDKLTEAYFTGAAAAPEYITTMERLVSQFGVDETV